MQDREKECKEDDIGSIYLVPFPNTEWMVDLPTCMVTFYGKNVGPKYTISLRIWD